MTWRTVFEGDLLSVRRSRLGLGIALTTLALTGGMAVLIGLVAGTGGGTGIRLEDLLYGIGLVGSLFLPFVAMMASYSAIVHEREHGSIRFLLGLPNSRADAYLGKLASRSLLFVLPALAGLGVVGVVGFALLAEPSVVQFAAVGVLLLAYGLVFVGFGLSASAALDNETSVTAGIITIWMAFRIGWLGLQYGAMYVVEGEQFSKPYPGWYYWLGRINPMNAFNKLVYEALGTPVQSGRILITNPHPATSSVATSTEFAAGVLVGWLVVAPLVGFLRFRDADLL